MQLTYKVRGGIPLVGDVVVGGSKNAALPLIAASLLATEGETVLRNVPDLRDVRAMLKILDYLGAQTSFEEGTVRIRAGTAQSKAIPGDLCASIRGSILFLGPLLARFGVAEMAYPGGDVIGKRPVGAHVEAFMQMGAEDMSTSDVLHLQGTLEPGHVILPEFSVTATENVVMAASLLPGATRIDLAASEPHVQEVEHFMEAMGAKIDGLGQHTVTVHGKTPLRGAEHSITFDYLEAGVFILGALISRGKIRLHGVDREHLLSFLDALRRFGAVWKYDAEEQVLFIDGELSSLKAMNVRTNIFPGFPSDLQAPMGVAMMQAKGVSRMFERLYEGRLAYLYELEKMGAHVEILNAHQALIIGPSPLRGRVVASNDIRAGAAMVLAALCAEGDTTITDIRYIERGYDRLDQKLRSLGAKIERMET